MTRRLLLAHGDAAALRVTLDFLGAHAVPGLETYTDGRWTRALPGPALLTLSPEGPDVAVSVTGTSTVDVVPLVTRLLDLDSDVAAVDAVLSADPALAPLVAARPGLRAPGAVDAFETLVRTVIGQQISVSGARTVTGRIVAEHGAAGPEGRRLFPSAVALAALAPATLPMPRARGRAVVAVARAFADGVVDASASRAQLLALPGVGPWTADYVSMRVGRAPDVLLASDLVVRRAADDLGIDLTDGRPGWAPWRSYATYHLWAHLYADIWRAAA